MRMPEACKHASEVVMNKRKAEITRKTLETNIKLSLNLDGTGKSSIHTSIGFMDHMLTLWSRHGLFDVKITARGDLDVDYHHTVEDIGLTLGMALDKTLGNRKGINRYGYSIVPMDEALALVSLDISGRPYLHYCVKTARKKIKDFPVELIEEFFRALTTRTGLTLHIKLLDGKDPHHIHEAIFKGFSKALQTAVTINPRNRGIPSTKGLI